MIFFPDTNFLLHFKAPAEIPWADVTPDDHIRLIICSNTQVEVDKKKFELRDRPQRRARKWASLIGELIATDAPKELRASNPKVTVELYLEGTRGWTPPPGLDVAPLGDDRYIGEVLAYQNHTGCVDCAVLTADTGPLGKSKRYGVLAVSAMGHGWELEDEPDAKDKENDRLRRELAENRRTGPEISLSTYVGDDAVKRIEIEVVRYPSLPETTVSSLVAELSRRNPRQTEFPSPIVGANPAPRRSGVDLADLAAPFDWVGPTDKEIAAYGAAYDRWLADARILIETAPASMQETQLTAVFEVNMANVGVEPADDLRISFEASAGILLCEEKGAGAKAEETIEPAKTRPKPLRPAPKPPAWKKVFRASSSPEPTKLGLPGIRSLVDRAALLGIPQADLQRLASGLHPGIDALRGIGLGLDGAFGPRSHAEMTSWVMPPLPSMPSPRDRERFYWRKKSLSVYSDRWEFECAHFRHHGAPEDWTVNVVVRSDALPPNGGSVEITVHARNLRKPTKLTVPVAINVRDGDTERLACSLLSLGTDQ